MSAFLSFPQVLSGNPVFSMGYITLWIPVFTGMTTFARVSDVNNLKMIF